MHRSMNYERLYHGLKQSVNRLKPCEREPASIASGITLQRKERGMSFKHLMNAAYDCGLGLLRHRRTNDRASSGLAGVIPIRPMVPPSVDEDNHPEALALAKFCVGKGIDVGCGHRKVAPDCIGVDLLASGEIGTHGVVATQKCIADIQASGDDLYMFADGELDYVVSRHNLEHYVDVVKTLAEWRRVLKPGGTMAIIVPDERAG